MWPRDCLLVEHICDEIHLLLCGSDLLCRRGLWSSEAEHRHDCEIWRVEELEIGRLVMGIVKEVWIVVWVLLVAEGLMMSKGAWRTQNLGARCGR